MEALLELDDDIFYKDLSMQISLLIMDDDDVHEGSVAHCPSVKLEAMTRTIHPAREGAIIGYEHELQIGQQESKGTGVFIPRASSRHHQNRKKKVKKGRGFSGNKSRRPCNCNCDHNSRALHIMSKSDSFTSSSFFR